jgi:hypothetical protein
MVEMVEMVEMLGRECGSGLSIRCGRHI